MREEVSRNAVADQLFVEAFEIQAARLRSRELVEAYRRITAAEALAYIAGGF
jgi:hypothetical protein